MNDTDYLIRRYPVLTTVAEHECHGDLCPCFSVLEVLEEQWRLMGERGEHDTDYVHFHEFVAFRVRKMSSECECGDLECRADHNFETSHEALWHDRI